MFESKIVLSEVKGQGQRSRSKVKVKVKVKGQVKVIDARLGSDAWTLFNQKNTSPWQTYPPPYPTHTNRYTHKKQRKTLFFCIKDHFISKMHVCNHILTKKMPKLIFYSFIRFLIQTYSFTRWKWGNDSNWPVLVSIRRKKYYRFIFFLKITILLQKTGYISRRSIICTSDLLE